MASRGFTLLEVLLCLLLMASLSGMAVWLYREQQHRAERAAVAALLQQNAVFLEQYFSENGSYKASPTSWPPLPHTQYPAQGSASYVLLFGTLPRNTDNGYYVLRASGVGEQRGYLELLQTGVLKYCEAQGSGEYCRLQ